MANLPSAPPQSVYGAPLAPPLASYGTHPRTAMKDNNLLKGRFQTKTGVRPKRKTFKKPMKPPAKFPANVQRRIFMRKNII